ncbi:sugar ABC transporter permease [Planosporangium flavigriseum]|uniref:Sugar ABC transporter permease n=1 Tax=Planosporangium flavigriseum TaxID=373681 RepID=A0A8J3PNK7_9ACTN|nr:sugar ABC transporter permease [Planosporangium flavigriseum]NJC65544.1 sugar ABC transporter permease [Planosporangium flavigriseum]GIG75018.1 sugar ABC transporter permease [Planosporangium flavigriseum]
MTTEAPPRALPRRESRKVAVSSSISPTKFGLMLVAPVAILLLATVVYPVLYSLYLSVQRVDPLTGAKSFAGLVNYSRALSDKATWWSLLITVYYTACVTLVSTGVALGSALILRERFRGRAVLVALIALPWSMSTYAAAVLWRYVYSPQYGLLAGLAERLGMDGVDFLSKSTVVPALAVVHAWQFAPLGAYFLLATLQSVPEDQYRLAKIDGMGVWLRFRHITMPYVRLPLAIFLVLVAGQAATAFDLIYFLTSGGPGNASRTLTFSVYETFFQNQEFGKGAAQSWILLILIIAVTSFYYFLIVTPRRSRGERKNT